MNVLWVITTQTSSIIILLLLDILVRYTIIEVYLMN